LPNLFDRTHYPEGIPDQLVIGDRWAWKRTDLRDYPPSAYELSYSLRLHDTATEVEVDASADGDDYVVEVGSTTTGAYTAGTYRWQAYITRTADSERVTIGRGTVTLVANRDAAGVDPRSHAEIMVAKLEAALQASAGTDVVSYSIGGRSVTRDRAAARQELARYREEVRAEENARRIASGRRATGNHIRVRLS